jgi:predicted porin
VGGPNPLRNTGMAIFNNAEISFKYQVTPALLLGIAYDYTTSSSVNGLDGATYHRGAIGADYFLSKRTDIYFAGIFQQASRINSLHQPAVAAINTVSPSSNNRQSVLRIGIREKF